MIRIMLVAGSNSKNLATFLVQRGTFEADFVYNDIHTNVADLMHKVVKVDKFIYVYKDDSSDNVRLDMQALQEVCKENKFFNAAEFVFLSADSELSTQAKSYFLTVMDNCGITSYDIRSVDSMVSFSSIYDNLIGITADKDFKNTYRVLYRRHRGDESNTAYEPEEDREAVIEPFDYKNVNGWDERKRLIASVERREPLFDSGAIQVEKWDNPDLGNLNVEGVFQRTEFVLVSGFSYSGKAVWASQLAASAVRNGKTCIIYDFTKSHSITMMPHGLKVIGMIEAMKLTDYPGESCLCTVDCSQMKAYMSYVIQKPVFDVVFILADFEQAEMVYESVKCQIVLVTSYSRIFYVDEVRKFFSGIGGARFFVCSWHGDMELSIQAIKERLGDASVIGKYEFKDYDNGWLFKKVVAGGGYGKDSVVAGQ